MPEWDRIMERGIGNMNENGQWIVGTMERGIVNMNENGKWIVGTMFLLQLLHHQLVLPYDHSLVIRLRPKKLHHAKQKGRPCINTANTSNPELSKQFVDSIEQNFH